MRSGKIRTRGIVTSVLATFMCVPAAPQSVPSQRVRQLSPEQGELVVRAAWELRKGLDPKPDCSHFVHAIYAKAGLEYEYTPTADLFLGVDAFRRVERPQAGDLVVWEGRGHFVGHVGIVVDPGEHTFYSSVMSGFAIEDYRSNYWTSRGHPRFYRYLIDEAQTARLRAEVAPARSAATRQTARSGFHSFSPRGAQASAEAGRTPASTSKEPDRTSSTAPAAPEEAQAQAEAEAADAEVSDVVFVSSRAHPLKAEVHAALLRASSMSADIALQDALLDTHRIAVADEFAVSEVKVQGRSGWAEIEFQQTAFIQNGKTELSAASEKWRLNLRRDAQGWMMIVSRDKTCLPRQVIVKTLAARIARISRSPENGEELKIAVKVLDDLLATATYVRVSEKE